MTGEDFLVLAERLADFSDEASFRTSVGRSYYGAFHLARRLLEDAGVVLPLGPEAHQKLRFCLRESGSQVAADAGRYLESLRQARNRADYVNVRRYASQVLKLPVR